MKRVTRIISLALVFAMLLGISAMAAETQRSLGAGFYGIGSASGVTIEARDANNTKTGVTTTSATVGNGTKVYHEGSVRLSVTYSGTAKTGDQLLVLLMDKNTSGVPNVEDAIWYINQEAKGSGSIVFDVYPTAPTAKTDMTLYITSSNKDFTTIAIPVSYTPANTSENTFTEAPYTLGDINKDGKWNSVDALLALQFAAGGECTTTEWASADVNRDEKVNSADALMILQYGAGIITSWN